MRYVTPFSLKRGACLALKLVQQIIAVRDIWCASRSSMKCEVQADLFIGVLIVKSTLFLRTLK